MLDIVAIAERIAAGYLRQTDPTDGVVQEAADENEHGKTWAVLMRPTGTWIYMLGYVPEEGWALFRFERDHISDGRELDINLVIPLGVYENRLNACSVALSMMEGQP